MLRLTIVLAVLLGATTALADVAPPPTSCEAQKVGAACLIGGKAGRCAQGEECHVPTACDAGGQPCQKTCVPKLVCQECKECESEGGCASAPGRPAAAAGVLLLGLSLALLARRRRR
jgi:MYXO-CTERM domain-containing protein